MEYQSFFMILKKYEIQKGAFVCPNPLDACGYAQIKKEQNNYFLIIQSNIWKEKSNIYVVCKDKIFKSEFVSSNIKIPLDFAVDINCLVTIVPELNLFCSLKGTQNCQQAYEMILQTKQSNNSILSKIFGKVYDTYFYDCIKSKVEQLFEMGKSTDKFLFFGQGRWTSLNCGATEMVVGVIYKNNFALAVAIGKKLSPNAQINQNVYKVDGQNYNILFLSAKDGKFMRFFNGILC